jgi:hypothetical protein
MALTYDRPGASADALNAAYAALRGAIADRLPVRLRDRLLDGEQVFDSSTLLDLDEDDDEADCVESVDDLPRAIVSKAARAWGRGRWSLALDSTGWAVEVRASSSSGPVSDRLHARATLTDLGSGDVEIEAQGFAVASPEGSAPGVVGAWETFSGSGIGEWSVGVATLRGLVEHFNGTGIGSWAVGGRYLIGASEASWQGWPAGPRPVLPPAGGPVVSVVVGDLASADLSEQIDGETMMFTLPAFLPGSVRLYLNGQRLAQGSDFEESSSTTITLADAIAAPEEPDALIADYVPCAC